MIGASQDPLPEQGDVTEPRTDIAGSAPESSPSQPRHSQPSPADFKELVLSIIAASIGLRSADPSIVSHTEPGDSAQRLCDNDDKKRLDSPDSDPG